MTPRQLRSWLLARAERQGLSGPFDLASSMAMDRAGVAAEEAHQEQIKLDAMRFIAEIEEAVR